MFNKKVNWKIYFLLILFGSTVSLAFYVTYLLATNQVTFEDDAPIPIAIRVLLIFLITAISSTYVITVISLIRRIAVYKRVAFQVDEAGIHNAMILINFLAFYIVLNVKFIPWSSTSLLNRGNESLFIKVKTSQISAPLLSKIILKLTGYSFGYGLTTSKMTEEETALVLSYIPKETDL
ncbi:MAG: hypothetical protein E7614_08990 [Ruminococcaceae bacterium]|nr:hypothetical protein [Oscillospiraceae bacterium]